MYKRTRDLRIFLPETFDASSWILIMFVCRYVLVVCLFRFKIDFIKLIFFMFHFWFDYYYTVLIFWCKSKSIGDLIDCSPFLKERINGKNDISLRDILISKIFRIWQMRIPCISNTNLTGLSVQSFEIHCHLHLYMLLCTLWLLLQWLLHPWNSIPNIPKYTNYSFFKLKLFENINVPNNNYEWPFSECSLPKFNYFIIS